MSVPVLGNSYSELFGAGSAILPRRREYGRITNKGVELTRGYLHFSLIHFGNIKMSQYFSRLSLALVIIVATGCGRDNSLEVVATAYTSHESQTNSQPRIAAWGAELKPGMKAIAVSRDLLDMGLGRGAEVEIEGLPGTWEVMDKMNARWEKRIDIYMGMDMEAAREWGKQTVIIRWDN